MSEQFQQVLKRFNKLHLVAKEQSVVFQYKDKLGTNILLSTSYIEDKKILFYMENILFVYNKNLYNTCPICSGVHDEYRVAGRPSCPHINKMVRELVEHAVEQKKMKLLLNNYDIHTITDDFEVLDL